VGTLTKPAIYKVGYKSGNPQCIRMITNRKSPFVHHPAIRNRARSVISISDSDPEAIEESVTEPDTDPEHHYSPENQLGLEENEACVDHLDVSSVSEASGKHRFDCRQMEAEDSA